LNSNKNGCASEEEQIVPQLACLHVNLAAWYRPHPQKKLAFTTSLDCRFLLSTSTGCFSFACLKIRQRKGAKMGIACTLLCTANPETEQIFTHKFHCCPLLSSCTSTSAQTCCMLPASSRPASESCAIPCYMLRPLFAVSLLVAAIVFWRCEAHVCVVSHRRIERLAKHVFSHVERLPRIFRGTRPIDFRMRVFAHLCSDLAPTHYRPCVNSISKQADVGTQTGSAVVPYERW
jgi:hypothetical protein